jgi:putative PIN family toxin of toxin-antitoxin system
LKNAYPYTDDAIEAWCRELHDISSMLSKPLPDIDPVCRDPDDDYVIAVVLVIDAGYIVTGDKDLLTLVQH